MFKLFRGKLAGATLLSGLLACTAAARAGDATRSYELMAADGDRTILIDLHLDGSIDRDFPEPHIAGTFDVASLDTAPDNALKGELLHVNIDKSNGWLLRHVLGDVEIDVKLHRPTAADMDVVRLNREQTDEYSRYFPPLRKHPYDRSVVRSEVVSVNGRKFSLVELSDHASYEFDEDYWVPVTPDCDAHVNLHYVTNDYGRNTATVAWARSLMGGIVDSLKIQVIENKQ